tara:strand:+ start:292 stop:480 length:189 start_codon:yes stop_codon:yes gene_type:complete
MKSEITKHLSETVKELERYELYYKNALNSILVDEDLIHFNRLKIQKLKVEVREIVNSLLLNI